jgi:hypothetical protein
MMKEIWGSREGLCKGKGGSMHIADADKGMLGANGIVGAGAPIAVGAALASRANGPGPDGLDVAIAFSGDGACNQGTTFEAMNLAVVTQAPCIFVFENNHYSEHTGFSYAVGTDRDIASRAEAFGMKAGAPTAPISSPCTRPCARCSPMCAAAAARRRWSSIPSVSSAISRAIRSAIAGRAKSSASAPSAIA